MSTNKFKGKIALVTGAGSGIGFELAKKFGELGVTVVGTDINEERIVKMQETLRGMGINAFGYRVDHTSISEVQDFHKKVTEEVGAVDILCANAGVGHNGSIGKITLDEWKFVLDINLYAVIYLVDLFIPSMIERKEGWVLITSSGNGLVPLGNMAPYNVSKSAVLSLSNTMHQELAKYNIGVSALCPAMVKTNIIKDSKMQGKGREEALKIFGEKSKASIQPSQVAEVAIKGLARGEAIIRLQTRTIMGDLAYRTAPGLFLKYGAYLFKKGRNMIGPIG